MTRILEGFEKNYEGVTVNKVDLMDNMEYAKKYNVRVVPTLVFLDPQGEVLFRHEGVMTAEQLKAKWGELGYTVNDRE